MEPSRKPLNVLARQLNAHIAIVLKNGLEYRGAMSYCDNFMNIILDGAAEYYDGRPIANYGKILVRGNNVLYVALDASHIRQVDHQNINASASGREGLGK